MVRQKTIHLASIAFLLVGVSSQMCLAADDGTESPSRWLPVDRQGWTVLRPAADTRIIYVSNSTGNDVTGLAYSPKDRAIGPDPFKPATHIKPFRSIAAGLSKARNDHPDWVLLRRGDVWLENVSLRNGRSSSEPSVVSSYGFQKDRPLLKTGKSGGINIRTKDCHYMVVIGLHFYAHTRDPGLSEYTGPKGKSGFKFYIGKGQTAKGLLLEDCSFRFYENNVIQGSGVIEDIVIRRSLILDNYSATSHSQGMYTKNVSLLLEENIFDHNGWFMRQIDRGNDKNDGQATMFNHNTYFCNSHDVTFRGNMFLRASSIGNKWTANNGSASAHNLIMDDNLYVEGELGISAGGNNPGPGRFKNVTISNNAFLHIGRGQPTRRPLGWGIDVMDWDGGTITGNLLIHRKTDKVTNVHLLSVEASDKKGLCRNVAVRNNVFCGASVHFTGNAKRLQGISFSGNRVLMPWIERPLIRSTVAMSGCVFSDNTYFSANPAERWFNLDNQGVSLQQWVLRTGEHGSNVETPRILETECMIESYMTHLGLKPTMEAFVTEIRKQSKANWRSEFTAATINDWARQGFGLHGIRESASNEPDSGDGK